MKELLILLCLAVIGGGIALGVLSHLRYTKAVTSGTNHETKKNYEQKRKKSIITGAAVGIVFLAFLIAVPAQMYSVESGEVAVVRAYGEIVRVEKPGLHIKNVLSETYEIYSTKVQQITLRKWCYVQDGTGATQVIEVISSVQFLINENDVDKIAKEYGSLDTLKERITTVILGVLETSAGGYTLDTLTTGTGKKDYQNAVRDLLIIEKDVENKTVEEHFYLSFRQVTIEEFVLEEALENALLKVRLAEAERKAAEEKYAQETAKIKAEAEQLAIKTKAEVDAKLAVAEGDAEARIIVAKAEAKAMKLRSIEIARALGFVIEEIKQEILDEDGAGTGIFEVVDYEIKFSDPESPEAKVMQEYLEYIAWLEAWDGKLPDVLVTDGSGINIIIPSNP